MIRISRIDCKWNSERIVFMTAKLYQNNTLLGSLLALNWRLHFHCLVNTEIFEFYVLKWTLICQISQTSSMTLDYLPVVTSSDAENYKSLFWQCPLQTRPTSEWRRWIKWSMRCVLYLFYQNYISPIIVFIFADMSSSNMLKCAATLILNCFTTF